MKKPRVRAGLSSLSRNAGPPARGEAPLRRGFLSALKKARSSVISVTHEPTDLHVI